MDSAIDSLEQRITEYQQYLDRMEKTASDVWLVSFGEEHHKLVTKKSAEDLIIAYDVAIETYLWAKTKIKEEAPYAERLAKAREGNLEISQSLLVHGFLKKLGGAPKDVEKVVEDELGAVLNI